jgi:hypothetical protein
MKKGKLAFIIPCTSFGVLGFYRGINKYKYDYKNAFDRYENDCKNYPDCKFNKPTFFYLNSFFYGTYGTLMYLNPFYIPVFMYKELYRLEVNVRGLDEEKKERKYYEVL